jgi:SAM-dependent methyltransferase
MAGSAVGNGQALTPETARAWIERWDRQQQGYLPDREDRFTALIDALEDAVGRPDPLVLDLGCGPGSLAVRVLERLPKATVVGIDADPLTMALGRAAFKDVAGLRFVDADLRAGGWSAGLNLERSPDAVVSTTALHWLTRDALVATYAEAATLLAPGGVVLNGDHMREDDTAPTLVRLGRAMAARREERSASAAPVENWEAWWAAVAADPDLAALNAERDARDVASEHHGSPAGLLSVHTRALQAAGFAEIGILWQHGYNRLLCAVMPG